MSKQRHTYDPGEPYDGPPPRSSRNRRNRAYRRENEMDDAWAAAGGDADAYDVDPAELAAGYDWQDDPYYGVRRAPRADTTNFDPNTGISELGPLPPESRHMRNQPSIPRDERIRRRYDRANLYPESPSFRRDSRLGGPISDDVYRSAERARQPLESGRAESRGSIPFIGVLILVILGVVALGAVVLACASILLVL